MSSLERSGGPPSLSASRRVISISPRLLAPESIQQIVGWATNKGLDRAATYRVLRNYGYYDARSRNSH